LTALTAVRRKRQNPWSAGFTLLEMLIVLVISSIVMATLIPNFGPAIARAQLYSATRDVASALRHVRGQAMLQGQDALFELNTEQHLYRVTGRSKLYKLPSEVQLGLYTTSSETLDEGTGRIRFFPDGSATGGRVTLIANKQTRVVDVNWLTGEVRMGEGDSDQ
jgi:general secretion pathway protein H